MTLGATTPEAVDQPLAARPSGQSPESSPTISLKPLADRVVCRLLCVGDGEQRRSRSRTVAAERVFSTAIILSGLRCLLGYVVVPIIAPAVGAVSGAAPYVGIPIGLAALVFDVIGVRRFWLADHKWRWPMTAVYLCVMVMVGSLLVGDLSKVL